MQLWRGSLHAEPAPPPLALPFPETFIRAGLSGFPSPSQDYDGRTLDLNERLIKRPSATFFMQVVNDGDSMLAHGIYPGEILVVDRSIDPRPGHILAALVDGEVIVYHLDLARHMTPPANHADLHTLLTTRQTLLRGRVTTYSPARSRVGYTLFQQDARYSPRFWDLVAAMGSVGISLEDSTQDMFEGLSEGR